MNKESLYLLKVLQCFIANQDPGPFDGDINQLVQLSGEQAVEGILAYTIMTYPHSCFVDIVTEDRHVAMRTIAIYAQRAALMDHLVHLLNEAHISHLLFKGYIVKNYYPVPELRSFGDIDFMIHPEDRVQCDELMMTNGFQRETDWEPVYTYRKQLEKYEIHTDIMEVDVSSKADYKGYYSHVWEHVVKKQDYTYELEPEFHFLYLLTHIAKHISGSGAGIRMYMDLAVFIKHFGDQLDYSYISNELEKLCFTQFANMALTIVEQYFGVKSPITLKAINDDVLEDFMIYTMEGGTFGAIGRDAAIIDLKQQSRNEKTSRLKTFLHRLFAPANELEKRYTYLKGHHYLVPLAWIHRLFKTKASWKQHAQEAKGIMNADLTEVERLKRIHKEIDL